MVAKPIETPVAVPVTGQRRARKEKYTRSTLKRALILGGIVAVGVVIRMVPYVGLINEGYRQIKTRQDIRQLSRDNELLRTELAQLRNPQRLTAWAENAGMVSRQSVEFYSLPPAPHKPQRPRSLLARLSPFSR